MAQLRYRPQAAGASMALRLPMAISSCHDSILLVGKRGYRQDDEPTINSPHGTSKPEQLISIVRRTQCIE